MGEIPLDGLADTGFEGFGGFPAKFAFEFAGIDGVAAIMTGTVGNEGDLFLVGLTVRSGAKLIEDGAKGMDDFQVGFFVPAANVIGFPDPARFENSPDGTAVVLDVEPVANLLTIAVDGQGLAGQGVVDDERDELFREVVGAVVVGAVGRQNWQPIGVVVGAYQMVGCSLARRIGTVGFIAVGFLEGGVFLVQGAIDFVGGDMQEAELAFCFAFEFAPVGTNGLEQAKGADDVGLDEVFWAMNAAVDMRLGSEVEDGTWLVFYKQLADEVEISDIAVHENVPFFTVHRS